jgi:F-type H+-transporting ATPase subunit b
LGGCLATAPRLAQAELPPSGARIAAILDEPAASQEAHRSEYVFDWVNFIILIALLIYFLRKPIAQFFRQRSEDIQKSLEEGRKALEAAQTQLAAAEERLRHLEQDIAALKADAARQTEAERERLHKAGEREAERILQSARHMIDSATQAAKLELKTHAVGEAIRLAERMIRDRLDGAARERLVSRFIQGLGSNLHSGPRVQS